MPFEVHHFIQDGEASFIRLSTVDLIYKDLECLVPAMAKLTLESIASVKPARDSLLQLRQFRYGLGTSRWQVLDLKFSPTLQGRAFKLRPLSQSVIPKPGFHERHSAALDNLIIRLSPRDAL